MYCTIPEHILRGISDLAKKLHFLIVFYANILIIILFWLFSGIIYQE